MHAAGLRAYALMQFFHEVFVIRDAGAIADSFREELLGTVVLGRISRRLLASTFLGLEAPISGAEAGRRAADAIREIMRAPRERSGYVAGYARLALLHFAECAECRNEAVAFIEDESVRHARTPLPLGRTGQAR